MVIIGGLGNIKGAILGVTTIVVFQEVMDYLMVDVGMLQIVSLVPAIYGIMLVIILRFFPGGLLGGREQRK